MGEIGPEQRKKLTSPSKVTMLWPHIKLEEGMGYQGDVLTYCPGDMDFDTVYAVIVSGDFPNPCGHALLFVPSTTATASDHGYYLQVSEPYGYPKIMSTEGYARYLNENGKTELTRYAVKIDNPEGAYGKLIQLMGKKWAWLLLPNNCAAFVEDVVKGGGSSAGLYSNCPRAEQFR